MQANSLFATFLVFIALVTPWAAHALKITAPTNFTMGNGVIDCTTEPQDPSGSLTFFIVRDSPAAQYTIADNVPGSPEPGPMHIPVTVPAGLSGDGWQIQARANGAVVGQSPVFAFAAAVPAHGSSPMNVAAIVAGIVGGVICLGLIVFFVVLRIRRLRRRYAGPSATTFDLKSGGFPPSNPKPSMSSTNSGSLDLEMGAQSIDLDKNLWERELEEQFARARAATPEVPRGISPMPTARGPGPGPGPGPRALPLAPQRAMTRL